MAKIISIFLAIYSFFLGLFGYPTYPHGDEVDMNKFELVWNDEFEGDAVDTNKWGAGWWPATPTSVRKGGFWNTKLASVSDGALHIATKYYENGLDGGAPGWYSPQLTTQGHFEQKYGYYECRCILPEGAGMWAAFWMMCKGVGTVNGDGKDGTEIDIFESAFYTDGKAWDTVQSALHFGGYGDAHQQKKVHQSHVYGNDPYKTYNTYGLEWNEKEYIFYINGVEAGRSSFGGVSQVPEYLLLSVEVGGNNGVPAASWCGPSVETNTGDISDFIVDYVRVYQYKDLLNG